MSLPLGYLLIALGLSAITVKRLNPPIETDSTHTIYIHTNGVHMDIAMHKDHVIPTLMQDIDLKVGYDYLSFGWGDENFYLHTQTWRDLTAKNAITAILLNSSALMHVKHYQQPEVDWIAIPVSDTELVNLNQYIENSFKTDVTGQKIILANQGYTDTDDFYKAYGSYTLFNTCNTWVNNGFKQSGLKASYWTPFDFGVLNKYR